MALASNRGLVPRPLLRVRGGGGGRRGTPPRREKGHLTVRLTDHQTGRQVTISLTGQLYKLPNGIEVLPQDDDDRDSE